MSVLTRANYIPNTLIESAKVNTDFNQLVDILSGVSTTKDALIKFSHATDPVLRVDQLGAGTIQRWLNNGTERASLSALGKLLLPAGIGATPSADQISNFGVYFTDVATRQTGANTNETDFSVKTVAANTFASDGDFMIILARTAFAANANTKRYRFYWDSTAMFDTGAVAFNNVAGFFIGYLLRESSSTISGIFTFPNGTAVTTSQTFVGTQNFANSHTIKTTGQNGAASAGDIIQAGLAVVKGCV